MVRLRLLAALLSVLALSVLALPVVAAEGSPLDQAAAPTPAASVEPLLEESAAGTASHATAPRELPRKPRTVSRVPQFAGPAVLKVDGTSGLYRWSDVFFGAQEVVMRVALVPTAGEESCAALVRLGTDKPPLHRHLYVADSARKTTHREVVDVDYETVPLTVTSDCGAWSVALIPGDDPTLPVTISERHYIVEGRSIAALERALRHIDGEWAALARTRADWRWWWTDRGSYCEVTSGAVTLRAWLTIPRWKRPPDLDTRVATEWERVRGALLVHELGHVTIALQAADAIDDRLDAGLRARTCRQVDRLADKTATAIWERHQDRDDRYDRDTGHGRTQGTWFE